VESDLDQVRTELRLALDRARLHLEWTEIALMLTQWRFEESTRPIRPEILRPEVPDRHVLSVLVVQPPGPTMTAPQPAADSEIDAPRDQR
jgi:hypothetical protein